MEVSGKLHLVNIAKCEPLVKVENSDADSKDDLDIVLNSEDPGQCLILMWKLLKRSHGHNLAMDTTFS